MTTPADPADTEDSQPFQPGAQARTSRRRWWRAAALWPTWLPPWIGPQIDHVLATSGITAETLQVRHIPGSDHRAVIARLHLSPAASSTIA